ncbi:MAG TPA: hypothetical protein VMD47_04080 [Candidatus Acidoferrales bacterium]|nr:hypothetical protein [Candidatus Acidoferrales bacterium]
MIRPDLISEDRESSRLLIVEVKRSIAERDQDFFMDQLRSYAVSLGKPETVYYVLVDSDWIRFYKEASPEPRFLRKLGTRETLRPYIGVDYEGVMSEFLIAGMTMAWLRDLAVHWKESNPPGSDELEPDIMDLLNKAGVRVESIP